MTSGPASESLESRDLGLGAALQSWVNAHAGARDIRLDGPREAIGMDPTWVLTMRTPHLEASACLFSGPVLDVSVFRPDRPDEGALVGGADGVTAEGLHEMLEDLHAAALGGQFPAWLRPAPR